MTLSPEFPSPPEATITNVRVEGLPEGISLGISSPRRGSSGALPFAFLLQGWLTSDTDVDHLEVWIGRRKLREVPVRLITEHREKLALTPRRAPRSFSLNRGVARGDLSLYRFSALVGTLRAPRSFTLSLRVALASNARREVCVITGTRPTLALPPRTTVRLSPLMVTSLGRTGTTWLMRLLSEHPELVLHMRYPYEVRPQRFWTHWLQVNAEPANPRESTSPDDFHKEPWSVGANPFFTAQVAKEDPALAQRLSGEHVVALAEFAHRATETYYLSCMARFDRPNARFSVEKHVPDVIPPLLWELYPEAKEIFLVRDPRDMLASIIAFNKKRGFSGFGRDRVETDADYVRHLARGVSGLMQTWRARRERAHLVRYEDLVTMPQDQLREIFDYIAIDSSADMVERVLRQANAPDASLAFHMTSSDQSASIGRWKRDLPADIQELASEAFGPALDEFGYSG
jgi:Sulfotransferase family